MTDHDHLWLTRSPSTGIETSRAVSPITTTTAANSRPALQRRATSQPPPRSKVRFNLSPQSDSPTSSGPSSPTKIRQRRQRSSVSNNASHHESGYGSDDVNNHSRDTDSRRRHRSDKAPEEARSPSPASSASTVDLPERFDKYGRPLPERGENDFADRFQEILEGKGSMGRLLRNWGLTGSGNNNDDEQRPGGGSGEGRRSRRRR